MKILWICALPLAVERAALGNTPHGAQVAASWILAHLPPPAEVQLHIACLWPGGDRRKTVEYDGAQIHLVPCPRRGRSLLLFQRDAAYFRPLFDELRPDVTHGWGTEDSFGLVARRLAPAHHLIGIQGLIGAYLKHAPMNPRCFLTAATERLTLARARYVVAESEYAIREARQLCPQSSVTRVVEHPLRSEFLEAAPSEAAAPSAIFVGALQERKGFADALRAFAHAAPPDWTLQVVGSGTLKEEQTFHGLVESLGLGHRVAHTPTCNAGEMVALMQASAVFLLPSRIDTGPTALKEALCMGLWPVCYDNSGPGEYIRNYGFGSLARNNDVTSLTEELRRAFEETPWRVNPNRSSLASRTRNDFSPETAWQKLLDYYQLIVSDRALEKESQREAIST